MNEQQIEVTQRLQSLLEDMMETIKRLKYENDTLTKDANEIIAAIVMEVGGRVEISHDTACNVYGKVLTSSRDLITDRMVFTVVDKHPENAARHH